MIGTTTLLYRDMNKDSERLGKHTKITQEVSGRTHI